MTQHAMGPNDNSVVVSTVRPNNQTRATRLAQRTRTNVSRRNNRRLSGANAGGLPNRATTTRTSAGGRTTRTSSVPTSTPSRRNAARRTAVRRSMGSGRTGGY